MPDPNFYVQLPPKERGRHVIGQIFWIPALVALQDLFVVRLGKWDKTQPIFAGDFELQRCTLRNVGKNSELYHHMPIPELKLKSSEELVVKKVKRRPGLLVLREGTSPRRLANFIMGRGDKPNPTEHLFAPIISLTKEASTGEDYPQKFIDRVREGHHPEFIHLPPDGVVLRNESMAVLSELQPHSIRVVEETQLQVDPTYFGVALQEFIEDLHGQLEGRLVDGGGSRDLAPN